MKRFKQYDDLGSKAVVAPPSDDAEPRAELADLLARKDDSAQDWLHQWEWKKVLARSTA